MKQDDVGMTNANGTDTDISNKLKDIVNLVNDGLDDYKRG